MNDTALCTQCVLPATFPQIQFNAQGVCNFCRQGEGSDEVTWGYDIFREAKIRRFWSRQTDRFPRARRLDLQRESGLRTTVLEGEDGTDLVLQFHHAACDGLGAMDFASNLLTAYANAAAGAEKYRCKHVDVQLLRSRTSFGVSRWNVLTHVRRQLLGLRTADRFRQQSPVSVVSHEPDLNDTSLPADYPDGCVHRFDSADTIAVSCCAALTRNWALSKNRTSGWHSYKCLDCCRRFPEQWKKL